MKGLENKTIFHRTIFLCAVYFLAMLASLYIPSLVYACLLIGVFAVVVLPTDAIFCLLLFCYPYANLIAVNPGGFSYFILIEYAAILMFIIRGNLRKINAVLVGLMGLLFVTISVTIESLSDYKYFVLLLKIILLLYFYVKEFDRNKTKYYFTFFVSGIVLSSFMGFAKTEIPRLLQFFENDLNYEAIGSSYVMRFSGINSDPNHYAIPLILCITVCLIDIFNKKTEKNILKIVLFCLLTVFGMLTLSKSFILIYLVTLLIALIMLGPKGKPKTIFIFILIFLIGIMLIPDEIIDNIMYRFTNITNTNVSTMNGREAIWDTYLEAINRSEFKKIFGYGMQAELINGRASHNIFLEMIYRCGIVGMVIYLSSIITIIKSHRGYCKHRSIFCHWGFIVIVVQYFFLSGFTVYDYTYYLMIAYIIYTHDFRNVESRIF